MEKTPKSLRTQIGIFGRTNVGKSSFLNYICGQDVAITSKEPGTTTDVVEKTMELLPIGPVVFLDTAGIDDTSNISTKRIEKTEKAFQRTDVCVLIIDNNIWGEFENIIANKAKKLDIPLIIVMNKIDITPSTKSFITDLKKDYKLILSCSSINNLEREATIKNFKNALSSALKNSMHEKTIIGDLLPAGGLAILIVPIDLEAPKGRIILPQVQTIRNALDSDAAALIVKEREYKFMLNNLKSSPSIVVCDSQVVMKMVADTPLEIPCTTFSILFARFKGDLQEKARGVAIIDYLKDNDKILIAEACSHHALEDDIGRIKIPRWLKQYTGLNLSIDIFSGRDYPENLSEYKLIIHCGACMITEKEMKNRIKHAKENNVYITNYGVAISFLQGVLKRVLTPFPAALNAFENETNRLKNE